MYYLYYIAKLWQHTVQGYFTISKRDLLHWTHKQPASLLINTALASWCSTMFIWYHLGVPPSMRFFSRANKEKVCSCLGEHLVTFGCTTGICEKPRNTNHRNDNSPWVSEEVIDPKVNFLSGWVLVVLIS